MNSLLKIIFSAFLLLSICPSYYSQTTKTDFSNFSTTQQPMFGTVGFNLNFEQSIFHVPWNSSFGPLGAILDPGFGLGQYGFEISGGTLGNIGARFYSRNWSGGDVDVSYPVDIELTYPTNNTFNRGDNITINSAYTVRNTAKIDTRFPSSGNIGLEMYFLMRFWLTPKFCFYSCITPGFDTGNLSTTLTLFDVSPNQVTYACPPSPPSTSLTCTESILPFEMPDNDFGFEGEFDLPNVSTTSQILGNKCLKAEGEDAYAYVGVDVFDLIGGMKIPFISPVLGALDNDACFLGDQICLSYTLLSATFGVNNYNVQEFNFCPTVYSSVGFPSPVEYTITDPTNNNTIVEGPSQSDTIRFKVGNDVNIKYPCNYEFMETSSQYDIENTFSNNTYDEIRFDFTLEAMTFGFVIKGFSTPGLYIDLPCVFYYPSFSGWSIKWKCGWDPPGFWAPPAITLGPWGDTLGPLYSQSFPIGSLPGIPWYDNSWELGGFSKQNGTNHQLQPKVFEINLLAKSDVSCFGEQNGSMQVQLTNGVPPFTYYWSDGSSKTTATSSDTHNSLPAGLHFVMVEDNNGCQVIVDSEILQPQDSLHLLSHSTTNVDCNGNSTGIISTVFTGGNNTYNYSWTPNNSNSPDATNLNAGIYNVNVTDDKGCSSSAEFTITEPSSLSLSISTDSASCFARNNGMASSTVSGGTTPYTYNWSNGSTVDTAAGLATGNYSLIVTDANNCTISSNFDIYEPDPIVISQTSQDVSCKGGSDGSIDLSVVGGSGSYNYVWYNNIPSALSSSSQDISNLTSSDYSVFVTDHNGCQNNLTISINEPIDSLSSSIIASNISCFNGVDGNIDLSVFGGTSPYFFNWNNSALTEDLQSLSIGNYVVTISDSKGCILKDSIILTEPVALSQSNFITNVGCHGDQTGAIDYTISGGTSPYSYNWSNGLTTQDLSNLSAGFFTINSTDNNGCTISEIIEISQPSAPLSIAGSTVPVSCQNGNNGEINTTVSGGTHPYTYNWSINNITINNLTGALLNQSSGTYGLVVSDSNNCTENSSFTINEPENPIGVTMTKTNILCHGENTGSVSAVVSGGTIPYSYNWNNGSLNPNINNLYAGSYSLVVTDSNNCTESDSILITEPSYSISAVVTSSDVSCKNGNDGFARIIPQGGTPNYTFSWNNGSTSYENNSLNAGIYTITVTDANNCIYLDTATINEPINTIQIDAIVIDSVKCKGANDGTITIRASQGTTPYTIYFGDSIYNLYNSANDYKLENISAGLVHINVIDANGCQIDSTINIPEPDTINFDFSVVDADCYGSADGEIDLSVFGGTPAYQYFWSNGQTSENISNLLANTYNVVIKDANNCMVEGSVKVDQPENIETYIYISEVSCKDNNDGFIELTVKGGVPGYSYLWSNNNTSSGIYDLLPGEYVVEITDNNSCIKIDTIYVNFVNIECISPPTVFTPDGDGINDTWVLDKLDIYPNAVVQIYNKTGRLLYETKGAYTPWNGMNNGNSLPSATYYYIIDLKNNSPAYTGTITILKSDK